MEGYGRQGGGKRPLTFPPPDPKRRRLEERQGSFQDEAGRILAVGRALLGGSLEQDTPMFGRPLPQAPPPDPQHSRLVELLSEEDCPPCRTLLLPSGAGLSELLRTYSLLCPGDTACRHGSRTLEGRRVCGAFPAVTRRLGEGRLQVLLPCAARAATLLRLLASTGLPGDPGATLLLSSLLPVRTPFPVPDLVPVTLPCGLERRVGIPQTSRFSLTLLSSYSWQGRGVAGVHPGPPHLGSPQCGARSRTSPGQAQPLSWW